MSIWKSCQVRKLDVKLQSAEKFCLSNTRIFYSLITTQLQQWLSIYFSHPPIPPPPVSISL